MAKSRLLDILSDGTPNNVSTFEDVNRPITTDQLSTPGGVTVQDIDNYSKYVDNVVFTNNQFYDETILTELRAQNQPNSHKVANGLLKFVGKTATNTAGGLGSLVTAVGMLGALPFKEYRKEFSYLYDNAFNKSLDEMNEWMDKNLPNYKTRREQEMGLLSQMTTTNFWADEFLGAMSFVAGAFLTEAATGGLGKLAHINKLKGKEILNRFSTADDYFNLSMKNAFWRTGVMARQMVTGAAYEAGVEARHFRKDALQKMEEEFYALNRRKPSEDEKKQIIDDINGLGNAVFAANLALVSASNIVLLSKLYKSPFSGFFTGRHLRRLGTKKVGDALKARTVAKVAGKASTALGKPIFEASEEFMQGLFSASAMKYVKSSYDFSGTNTVYTFADAFHQSLAENIDDKDAQKEALIGALMGAIGLPGFSPGSVQEALGQSELMKTVNNYNSKSQSLKNVAKNLIRQASYNNAPKLSDTATFNSLVSWIESSYNVGRLDSDIASLEEQLLNLSDTELANEGISTQGNITQNIKEQIQGIKYVADNYKAAAGLSRDLLLYDDEDLKSGLTYAITATKVLEAQVNNIDDYINEIDSNIDLGLTGKSREDNVENSPHKSVIKILLNERDVINRHREKLTDTYNSLFTKAGQKRFIDERDKYVTKALEDEMLSNVYEEGIQERIKYLQENYSGEFTKRKIENLLNGDRPGFYKRSSFTDGTVKQYEESILRNWSALILNDPIQAQKVKDEIETTENTPPKQPKQKSAESKKAKDLTPEEKARKKKEALAAIFGAPKDSTKQDATASAPQSRGTEDIMATLFGAKSASTQETSETPPEQKIELTEKEKALQAIFGTTAKKEDKKAAENLSKLTSNPSLYNRIIKRDDTDYEGDIDVEKLSFEIIPYELPEDEIYSTRYTPKGYAIQKGIVDRNFNRVTILVKHGDNIIGGLSNPDYFGKYDGTTFTPLDPNRLSDLKQINPNWDHNTPTGRIFTDTYNAYKAFIEAIMDGDISLAKEIMRVNRYNFKMSKSDKGPKVSELGDSMKYQISKKHGKTYYISNGTEGYYYLKDKDWIKVEDPNIITALDREFSKVVGNKNVNSVRILLQLTNRKDFSTLRGAASTQEDIHKLESNVSKVFDLAMEGYSKEVDQEIIFRAVEHDLGKKAAPDTKRPINLTPKGINLPISLRDSKGNKIKTNNDIIASFEDNKFSIKIRLSPGVIINIRSGSRGWYIESTQSDSTKTIGPKFTVTGLINALQKMNLKEYTMDVSDLPYADPREVGFGDYILDNPIEVNYVLAEKRGWKEKVDQKKENDTSGLTLIEKISLLNKEEDVTPAPLNKRTPQQRKRDTGEANPLFSSNISFSTYITHILPSQEVALSAQDSKMIDSLVAAGLAGKGILRPSLSEVMDEIERIRERFNPMAWAHKLRKSGFNNVDGEAVLKRIIGIYNAMSVNGVLFLLDGPNNEGFYETDFYITEQIRDNVVSLLEFYGEDPLSEINEEDQAVELFSKSGNRYGGLNKESAALKAFIGLSIAEYDYFNVGVSDSYPLDGSKIYNACIECLKNVPKANMITSLRDYSNWNPNVGAFLARLEEHIAAELGVSNLDNVPHEQLEESSYYNMFINGFYKREAKYYQVNFDGNEGKAFNAAQDSSAKLQVDRWNTLFRGRDLKKGDTLELLNRIKANLSTKLPDEPAKALHTIQRLRKNIKESLNILGIDISEGLINYSLIKELDIPDSPQKEQYLKDHAHLENEEHLTLGFVKGLTEGVHSGDMYAPGTGSRERMVRLANTNTYFDERVRAHSFENAEGERIYSVSHYSYDNQIVDHLNSIPDLVTVVNNPEEFRAHMKSLGYSDSQIEIYRKFLATNTNLSSIEQVNLMGSRKGRRSKSFHRLGKRAKLLTALNLFASSSPTYDSKNKRLFLTHVNEAKSTARAYALTKRTLYSKGQVTREMTDRVASQIKAEISRISQVRNEIQDGSNILIDGYHHVDNLTYDLEGNPVKIEDWYNPVTETYSEFFVSSSENKPARVPRGLSINAFQHPSIDDLNDKILRGEQIGDGEIAAAAVSYLDTEIKRFEELLIEEKLLKNNKPQNLPQYYKEGTMDKLGNFFMNSLYASIEIGNIHYGDISIGHKGSVDVVKRNSGLIAAGPDMGSGYSKIAVIPANTEEMNNPLIATPGIQDTQDAQSYVSPNWYLNTYLKAMGKVDPRVREIYENILIGKPLTPSQEAYLDRKAALLTDRKIVIRDTFNYIKTSAHVVTREKVSTRNMEISNEELLERYKNLEELDGEERASYYHEQIRPAYQAVPGREYEHRMLNAMERTGTDIISVDSASKMVTSKSEGFDGGEFRLKPFEVSNSFIREQVKTDSFKTKVIHGTQLMSLVWSEQADPERAFQYLNLLAKRVIAGSRSYRSIIGKEEPNYSELWDKMERGMFSSNPLMQVTELLRVVDGETIYSWNLPVATTKAESSYIAVASKDTLSHKVPGHKFTLVSDEGFLGLRWGVKEGDKYVCECAIPEKVARELGIKKGDLMSGVRIPTQDKHSMVSLKVTHIIEGAYSSSIIMPPEVVYLSGADFDIDSLFVHTRDPKSSYLEYDDPQRRKEEASKEYLRENKELPPDFYSTVEDNYKHYKNNEWDKIKPFSLAEINNLLLEMELELIANEGNISIAGTKASLDPFKEASEYLGDFLSEEPIKGNYSIVDYLNADASNQVGKVGIGPAALFNSSFQKMLQYGTVMRDVFGRDVKIDSPLNQEGERINDIISSVITAMTDNAKEQIASKFNLTLDTLGAFLVGISSGVPFNTMALYFSSPAVKQIAKDLSERSELFGTNFVKLEKTIFKPLKKGFTPTKGYKIPSNEEVLSILKEDKRDSQEWNDLQYQIGSYFIDTKKVADELRNFSYLLQLSKGLKPKWEDNQFFDRLEELGIKAEIVEISNEVSDLKVTEESIHFPSFGKYYELKLSRLTNELSSKKTDLYESILQDETLRTQLGFFAQALTDSGKVFVKTTPKFREFYKQSTEYIDYRANRFSDYMLGFLVARSYQDMSGYKADESVLYESIGDMGVIEYVSTKLKDTEYGSNALLNLIRYSKKENLHVVEGNSRSHSDPDFDQMIMNSFYELAAPRRDVRGSYREAVSKQKFIDSLDAPQLASLYVSLLYDYYLAKDGGVMRNNSISKHFHPIVFNRLAKASDLLLNQDYNYSARDFAEAFFSVEGHKYYTQHYSESDFPGKITKVGTYGSYKPEGEAAVFPGSISDPQGVWIKQGMVKGVAHYKLVKSQGDVLPFVTRFNEGDRTAITEEFGPMFPRSEEDLVDAFIKVFGVSERVARDVASLYQAAAENWSRNTGRNATEWYENKITSILKGDVDELFKSAGRKRLRGEKVHAAYDLTNRVLYALENPTGRDLIHELAHIFESELSSEDRKAISEWAGQETFNESASEQFARGFELYVLEGNAPNDKIQNIFDRMVSWLRKLYNHIVHYMGKRVKLDPKISAIFDKILAGDFGIATPSQAEIRTSSKVPSYLAQLEGKPITQKSAAEVILNMQAQVTFDDTLQTYVLPDGTPMKRVSEVLQENDFYSFKGDQDAFETNREWGNEVDRILTMIIEGVDAETILSGINETYISRPAARAAYDHLVEIRLAFPNDIIMTQMIVFNEDKGVAGTMDVVIVHRDGTVSVRDLKTSKNPITKGYYTDSGYYNRYDKGFKSKDGKEYASKKERHEAQLSMYAHMLTHHNLNLSRNQPIGVIAMHVTDYEGSRITSLEPEENKNRYRLLSEFDTYGNLSVDPSLNSYLERMRLLLGKRIEQMKSSGRNPYFVESLLAAIKGTNAAIAVNEYTNELSAVILGNDKFEGYFTIFNDILSKIPTSATKMADMNRLEHVRKIVEVLKEDDTLRNLRLIVAESEKLPNSLASQLQRVIDALDLMDKSYREVVPDVIATELAKSVSSDKVDAIERRLIELEDNLLKLKNKNANPKRIKALEKTIKAEREKYMVDGKIDLKELIKRDIVEGGYKDISALDKWLNPAISVDNSFLATFALTMKRALHRAQVAAMNVRNQMRKEFEKFAPKNLVATPPEILYKDMCYEKNYKGKKILALVSPIDYNKFHAAKAEMYKQAKGIEDPKRRKKFVATWFSENTQARPQEDQVSNGAVLIKGVKTVVNEKKRLFGGNKYSLNRWLNANVKKDAAGNTVYMRELAIPRLDMYSSNQFQELKTKPDTYSYYTYLLKTYQEAQNRVAPRNSTEMGFVLPMVSKNTTDRFREDAIKKGNWLGFIGYELSNLALTKAEDYQEENLQSSTKTIPVLYYNLGNAMEAKDTSKDLTHSILKFSQASFDYVEQQKHQVLADNLVDLTKRTKPAVTDSAGFKVLSKAAKLAGVQDSVNKYIQKHNNNVAGLLEAYVDTIIYGKRRVNDRYHIPLLKGEIDMGKIANTLMGAASLTQLGGNPLLSVANSLQARAMAYMESAAGEVWGLRNWVKASKVIYNAQINNFIQDTFSPYNKSKIGQLIDLYDPMQGDFKDNFGRKISKSQMRDKLSTSTWFALQNAGEHHIQVSSMIAAMLNKEVETVDGKISLWDAYDTDSEGNLKLKEGVLMGELVDYDLMDKIHATNKRLHGVYNGFDAPIIERHWWGRLLLFYRKYLVPGWKKRFKATGYDYELGEFTQGTYSTFYTKLLTERFDLIRQMREEDSELTSLEKANIRRALMEHGIITGVGFMVYILQALMADMDDDEKIPYQFSLYWAMRLNAEMSIYGAVGGDPAFPLLPNINEMKAPYRTPTAAISIIDKASRLYYYMAKDIGNLMWGEDIERYARDTGMFDKGDSKTYAALLKLMGMNKNLSSPEEAIKGLILTKGASR